MEVALQPQQHGASAAEKSYARPATLCFMNAPARRNSCRQEMGAGGEAIGWCFPPISVKGSAGAVLSFE